MYNPQNHYWVKADGTIYSSEAMGIIAADDAAYLEWLDRGGKPTRYPLDEAGNESEAELAAVLAAHGLFVSARAKREAEILAELDALDAATTRPLRAVLAAQATSKTPAQADLTRLADLEAQAKALRAELAALGAA